MPLKACGAHLVDALVARHGRRPSRPCGPTATVPFPPLSFTAAGATGKTTKVGFETQDASRSWVTAREAHQGMQ